MMDTVRPSRRGGVSVSDMGHASVDGEIGAGRKAGSG